MNEWINKSYEQVGEAVRSEQTINKFDFRNSIDLNRKTLNLMTDCELRRWTSIPFKPTNDDGDDDDGGGHDDDDDDDDDDTALDSRRNYSRNIIIDDDEKKMQALLLCLIKRNNK